MSGFEMPIEMPNSGANDSSSESIRPPQRYSWETRQLLASAVQDLVGFKDSADPPKRDPQALLEEKRFHDKLAFLMD